MYLQIIAFISSFILLAISSYFLVDSLEKISWFLGLKKFVIGFLVVGLAVSIPNLFIAINSAHLAVPKLSLGEIFGGNIAILTLIIGILALISRNGLILKCQLIQKSTIFILGIVVLPFLLMLDGYLDKADGIILIFAFFVYSYWLFIKKGRFKATYTEKVKKTDFFKSLILLIISLSFLLLSSFSIVETSTFFAEQIGLSLWVIGLLVVGIFASLPETIFGIHAARAGEDELVIGNLMGSFIGCFTLVLGILILIQPFQVDLSPLFLVQVFLTIAAVTFIFFKKTKQRITQTEGLFLIAFYFIFFFIQLFVG